MGGQQIFRGSPSTSTTLAVGWSRAGAVQYALSMRVPGSSHDDLDRLNRETAGVLGPMAAEYTDAQVDEFVADRVRALRILQQGADHVPVVIFVCVHNAGRSQMAAGWARHLAGDRAVFFSGGSVPGPEVNPVAIAAMAEVGIDISAEFPKPFTDELVEASDVVVTMGCGDACPFFPGKKYVDWELTDPHDQGIELVRAVRDEVEQRVRDLLSELGVKVDSNE